MYRHRQATTNNDLNKYLKESYVKSMLEIDENEMTCQPILNHVSATSGHLVEHLTVVSQLYVDGTNITDCIDYKNVHLKKEFNFMPVSADGYVVYNKGCIALLNYDIAVKSLKDKYLDPDTVKHTLLQSILNFNCDIQYEG